VPEEKFASSEHDLIQEITAPFSAVREDPEADPGEADFPIVLRGYDRVAVDAYIRQARQMIDDLRATSSPEAAVRRALERVGEEVAGILQRAHDTAEKITTQSRSEAEDRLVAARGEAAKIQADAEAELEQARRDGVEIRAAAERKLTELDADTDRIWAERHRIVEDARELSRQLLGMADSAAERFPPAEDTVTGETMAGPVEIEEPTVHQEPARQWLEDQRPTPADEPDGGPYDHAAPPEEEPALPGDDVAPPGDHEAPPGDDDTESTRVMPPPEH
jgi:F0F1-type ATP synthase membrane subunit b/b'